MYFSDSEGNKIDPEQLGIEHEAKDGAYDVTLFGPGQTGRSPSLQRYNRPLISTSLSNTPSTSASMPSMR